MIIINGFVTQLDKGEYLIVGTNGLGHHLGGAAQTAHKYFGAVWGESRGILGSNSYGIVTLDRRMNKLSIGEIRVQIPHLIKIANENPELKFYLTPIGTGIAGFTYEEIEPLFNKLPGNIIKVGWRK